MPVDISQKLLKKFPLKKKTYLNGKKDIHEKRFKASQRCEKQRHRARKKNNNWIKISCAKNGKPLPVGRNKPNIAEKNNAVFVLIFMIIKFQKISDEAIIPITPIKATPGLIFFRRKKRLLKPGKEKVYERG